MLRQSSAGFSRISISPKRRLVVISFTLHAHLTLMNTLQPVKFRKKFACSSFHTQEVTQGTRGWISFESHSSHKRLKRGLHDLLSPLDDCEGILLLSEKFDPIFRDVAPPICQRQVPTLAAGRNARCSARQLNAGLFASSFGAVHWKRSNSSEGYVSTR